MKLSLNWIKEFVDFPAGSYSVKDLAHLLTLRTCEVEGFEYKIPDMIGLEDIVIGEVVDFKKIDGSEKLHVAKVNIGRGEPIQLIFGDKMPMEIGKRVPVAVAPATLPSGIKIEAKKMMGVLTEGMLCLDQELGLKKDGISMHFFPNAKPGTHFPEAYIAWQNEKFANIVVGKVLSITKHPNADRLNVVEVDVGTDVRNIVCGGQNLVPNMLVAVALPGAKTLDHDGTYFEIKKSAIRGVESNGMICAEREIGLTPLTPVGTFDPQLVIADVGLICKKIKAPTPTPGIALAEALNNVDIIFEVDNKSITHRPDLWGHYGMAREFAAFWGKKLKDLKYRNNFPDSGESVKVEIAQSGIASRFTSAIIKGIKVGDSPKWMQERLKAAGMRPINNIVDITNYVMLELGHPLHAFDRRVVANDSFVIRFASEGEVVETLDHKKRTMTAHDALVTNGQTALGLAGIMGGLNSEITDDTTEIILEVACWNPVMVRKTSQRQNLRSEAAARFEKSLDPEYTGFAFQRAVQLILKICRGSQLAGPATDVYPDRPQLPTILLNTAKVNSMIGTNLSEKEISTYLKGLQFTVQKESKGVLRVTVPSWRATKDISIEEDLVEEVARAHGYENLAPHRVALPIKAPVIDPERQAMQKARSILSLALGFNESVTYSFYGQRELDEFLLAESPLEGAHFNVANPLSQDQTHLRISLIPNLLKAAVRNSVTHETVKLFEIGRTYIKQENKFMPKEERYCSAVCILKNPDLKGGSSFGVFNETLGSLRAFLENMKVPNVSIERAGDTIAPYKHPRAHALVKSGNRTIASVYEVNPLVLKNLDCPRDAQAAAFEINFSHLVSIGEKPFVYKPMPKFPGIEIDVSVLVDSDTEIGTVADSLKSTPSNGLIQDVRFMHLFDDETKLGVGKKSLTMRILLQSPDRTLIDEEMKTVQQALFNQIEKKGWKVR